MDPSRMHSGDDIGCCFVFCVCNLVAQVWPCCFYDLCFKLCTYYLAELSKGNYWSLFYICSLKFSCNWRECITLYDL